MPKDGGGLELKKLPPWAWAVAIVGGLLVGWFLLRRNGASSQAQAPNVGGSPEIAGALSGQPQANAAPADGLSPAVLEALGVTLQQVGSLGNALADVAIGAQGQLGQISTTALAGSLSVAQESVAGSFNLAGQSVSSSFDLVREAMKASSAPVINITSALGPQRSAPPPESEPSTSYPTTYSVTAGPIPAWVPGVPISPTGPLSGFVIG